ncbi:uncharacterized protein [Alexandromys fortis]|uniref:uncharacterized protein n=1 Tax=Alexandromys fortis TaxID=100897 RepID=UPI00215243EB|nr:uncharacterized protein LOC126513807 [Microtus fortis]
MLSRLRRLLARENGDQGETRGRQKEAGPRSHQKTGRNKWSWGRRRTTGEAPSQLSTFTEKQQQMKKLEELTHQLHEMTCEADELRQFLANYTDKDLNNRLNFEFEMLKMEHNQVVSDQLKLPREISKAVDKCNQLMEETESVGCRHGQVLRDRTQLKKKVHVLRLKNILLRKEKIELQETCEEAKRLLKEAHEKICGPCAEQQQEQESLEEGLKNVLKQKELVTQHGDLAEKLQHHLSVPEMSSENLQSELERVTTQDKSFLQTELQQQEH